MNKIIGTLNGIEVESLGAELVSVGGQEPILLGKLIKFTQPGQLIIYPESKLAKPPRDGD